MYGALESVIDLSGMVEQIFSCGEIFTVCVSCFTGK